MKTTVIQVLLIILLLVGCGGEPEITPNPQSANNDSSTPPTANLLDIATTETIQEAQESQTEQEIQQEIDACFANPDHPIALEIAAEYPATDYTQVMDWFCSGFEFEDILTALQTAELSDFHPEILLTMLEYGQTWEEIWAEIGLK